MVVINPESRRGLRGRKGNVESEGWGVSAGAAHKQSRGQEWKGEQATHMHRAAAPAAECRAMTGLLL
jgi:hypothetical protein